MIFFVVNYKNSKTPLKIEKKKYFTHVSVANTLCFHKFLSPQGKGEGYYDFFCIFMGKMSKMPTN